MYITGIDPSVWTTSSENMLGALGVNATSQGTKTYRYVKLRNETSTVSGDGGDMVAYLSAPANDDEIHTVVTDNTDAPTKRIAAGMIEADSDGNFTIDDSSSATVPGVAGTAYYGWVQCAGMR